jgi:sulfur carrier protein
LALNGSKKPEMGTKRMNSTIQINGEQEPLQAKTVAELLRSKAINPDNKGIAIALNGRLRPRIAWEHTALSPDDSVEIVKAFAGG